MKVISFNLAGYKDWAERKKPIVDMLSDEGADIVLLQEVKFDPEHSGFSQAREVNSSLKNPYEYMVADVTKYYRPSSSKPYREGLAVLSRLAVVQSETLVLSQAEDDRHPRIIQLLDLKMGSRVLKIANVHFSNNKYSVGQLSELLQILDARGEQRLIAGDYNILTLEQVRRIAGERYRLAYDNQAYKSFKSEDITLDHVMIPHDWIFKSVEVIDDLSDHSAVVCEVKEEL